MKTIHTLSLPLVLFLLLTGCTEKDNTPVPVTPPTSTTTVTPPVSMTTATPAAPTITSFSPKSGNTGTQVVITGTNFSTASADNVVQFNGKAAKVVAANATTLTVEVPEKAGIGTVSVEANGQKATSGTLFTFYYSATTSKVAGDFKSPQGICMDGKGNIYVPDRGNGQIKMIKPDGSVNTIAGSTPASATNGPLYGVKGSQARFAVITGLTVDAAGENLYAVDEYTLPGSFGGYILKIDLTNSNYFVQQLGQKLTGHPTAIRLDEAGKLLYVNSFTTTTLAGLVRTIKTDGTDLKTIIGSASAVGFNPVSAGELDGLSARLKVPMGTFLTKDGQSYYFTDEHNHAIRVYNTSTKKVKTLAGTGIATTTTTYKDDLFSNADATFAQPTGIALDSEGRIYVTEWKTSKTLRVYDPKSDKWQTLLTGMRSPYGLIINNKDELFVSEWTGAGDSVLKVTVK